MENDSYDSLLKQYRDTFARDHKGPYAIQWPGRSWATRYKPVSDPLLKAHLSGQYWVGVKSAWYPTFYFLDVDAPKSGTLNRIIEVLKLQHGQYQLMTSPSYTSNQSCHIALRLEYKGKQVTHKLGYEALRNMVGSTCEVYPQKRRKFRLPFGRGQYLIGDDGRILDSIAWWDGMYWLNKIDPLPIETLSFQQDLPFPSLAKDEDNPRNWVKSAQAQQLYDEGLQRHGTRHASQWILALQMWRSNWLPHDAIAALCKWIRKRHNGFSKTVNNGNWREVDAEIHRQVQWIWSNFRGYPDSPHNLEGYVTRADLKWIAEIYPGDIVNQKRLFALVYYVRPRAHHGYVYVPHQVWREQIANDRTYHDFRENLEAKGLLESVMPYRHVDGAPEASYSRKFRLLLPCSDNQAIQCDGRNVQDYYEALRLIIGSVKEMVFFTKVSHQRFYEVKRNKYIYSGKSNAQNTQHNITVIGPRC